MLYLDNSIIYSVSETFRYLSIEHSVFEHHFHSVAGFRSSTYVVPTGPYAINAHDNASRAFNQILGFFRFHSFWMTYSMPDRQHFEEATADGSFDIV